MPFELAKALESHHLMVYPPDRALNPPQSYLFVQDSLILLCAILYCFAYVFYTSRTRRDKFLAGPVDLMFVNLAYEMYFPFVVASTPLQVAGSLVWLLLDLRFVYTAIKHACPPDRRLATTLRSGLCALLGALFLHGLGRYFPDDGEQVTAYWTGWMLEFPVGWVSIMYLDRHGTKGQSLEIWAVRFSGSLAALGVFVWRYLNVPQNWAYVGSWPSIVLVTLTMAPEIVYPFVFKRTEERLLRQKKAKGA